ncbi:hypothetical protein L6164_025659 [Bauhinia variegata]|uniref:Uncharacterized protein n=1 Tax=Bauhinia variegata TaxID=167791 RepID=A0ACB9M2N0_BAUVA|nr:hypothetical protein L6164_025659 [Bauhinia variegata]
MNGAASIEGEYSEFVEVDPSGRYGRYNEILGKGASKTVYRAFDEYEGIEVAWNQVKLYDFLKNPEDLERLYCEIHLLKTLNHKNIMKFYTSWVDTANRHINFVTEMFTSGTLRQYRLKHRRVNIRAVKHWCRQILEGLLYLHSRNPPVIHRDLKCDNIFINGNQGEVKIGDLGLAAILRKSSAACCVGTPEFMAPEVYEEDYNELVDIYSFGMCILEMVTFEYPYSECANPAQIYKKVVSGKKPESLYKVQDPEVRQFVEKCLATVSLRLSAKELLKDHFLQIDDYGFDLKHLQYERDSYEATPLIRQPLNGFHSSSSSLINGYSDYLSAYDHESELDHHQTDSKISEIDLFECEEDDNLVEVDTTIKGRREDNGIFLRLRIADKEGRVRNIYFPFDIKTDTALSVAYEMVDELELAHQDVTKIADMIDNEIATLEPDWNRGPRTVNSPECNCASFCPNCASNANLFDYASPTKNLQILPCSRNGRAAVHGRFEEITYQVEGSEQCSTEGAPAASSQSTNIHYTDIWAQRDEPELGSDNLKDIHCDESPCETSNQSTINDDERSITVDDESDPNTKNPLSTHVSDGALLDYENEIRQELRWLKAKYQMQLRELRDQQLGGKPKLISIAPESENLQHKKDAAAASILSVATQLKTQNKRPLPRPLAFGKLQAIMTNKMVQDIDETSGSNSPEQMVTAQDFYASGALLPQSLHRATSLPVDAIDF